MSVDNKQKADEIIRLFLSLSQKERQELVGELIKKVSLEGPEGDNIAEVKL